MMTARNAKIKLDNLSVIIVLKYGIFAHTIVTKKPVNSPMMTPCRVVFLHPKVITNTGPNAEPRPLQA